MRRLVLLLALVLAACSSGSHETLGGENTSTAAVTAGSTQRLQPRDTSPTTLPTSSTTTHATSTTGNPADLHNPQSHPRPAWLGSRPLTLRPGETNAVAEPTPAELVNRQLWTVDTLPPPTTDRFVRSITTPPPASVVARSTWRHDCPVPLEDLSYATVSFIGFDGLFHTGEFIVNRNAVEGLVEIFRQLHAERFPIEEMRVTTQADVDAHPTGDSNNTSSFVCRAAVNSGSWSRHAHGGAIDINPFHNPYIKDDLVIPELASAYLDREREVPGMVTPEIEAKFRDLDWGWGGNWSSASDWMHFSDTGN